MANLIPQDIREWMRRMEFKTNDLTRRMSNLIPGDIADGVDLDGFMSSGRWRRPSTIGTTTALHYPFAGASGTLEVYWEPTNDQVQQIWYDRGGSIWSRWWNAVSWSAWEPSDASGLATVATATIAGNQNVTSTTLAALPTTVTTSLTLPAGTSLVLASVSGLIGSTNSFAPSVSASLKYNLTGALTFTPGANAAGVAGLNQPIASGGGTLSRVHSVTLTTPASLTITAIALVHNAGTVVMREITVQLTVLRRQ